MAIHPEEAKGLSLGFQPQVSKKESSRPVGAAENAFQSQMYRSSKRMLCFFRSALISSWNVISR